MLIVVVITGVVRVVLVDSLFVLISLWAVLLEISTCMVVVKGQDY